MRLSDISVLVEPAYMLTPWWEETRTGMESELMRKGIRAEYHFLDSLDRLALDRNSVMILAGETLAWIDGALNQCERAGTRAVLACSDLDRATSLVSCITLSRSEIMSKAVRYLYACGKMAICAFAMNPDSPADMRKIEGFINTARHFGISPNDSDIIKYAGSIAECFNLFLNSIRSYNAVICTNDLSARYLITRLMECGINVPEDMYVMSFGNTLTGCHAEPSITTVTLDLQELGRQAIKASIFLYENDIVNSINVTIDCHIIARQSTANILPENLAVLSDNNPCYSGKSRSSYSDPLLNQLVRLERCIASCDKIDIKIIKGILAGKTYPQLADELFIADGTLRYRLERIFGALGISSRKELTVIFTRFMPNFSMD